MLFKVKEFYIEATSEKEAMAKYAAYYFECGFTNFLNMNVDTEFITDELTSEEYFNSIADKLLKLYPGSFINKNNSRYIINVVLKCSENDEKRVVAAVIPEHIKGVFTFMVGIENCDMSEFSIVAHSGNLNELIENINNEFKVYSERI